MAGLIDDLLAFDATEELLSFRFRFAGMLMWPFVRFRLYRMAVQGDLGWQPAHAASEARTLLQRADYIARTALSNPLTVGRPFDIVICGSGAGVVVERDGRWFDRINDYFAVEYPDDTLVVDSSFRRTYRHPRHPAHLRRHDGLPLLAGAIAKVATIGAGDEAASGELLRLVHERFPAPLPAGALEEIRAQLRYLATRLPYLHWFYRRFLRRVRPRILFVEDGHYGGSAHLLAWARDEGIVTAEFQHGLIAKSHLAYNYGERIRTSTEYRKYLPQHLLLYGTYWKEQVRTPAEPVVIGAPHFSARKEELVARAPTATRNVLVISQGDCTERMVSLTETLAGLLPQRRFVFRLHPAEVPFVERYQRLRAIANVAISDSGDLYDCFPGADAVIGPASTAMFEAAGCDIPIFIDDNRTSDLFVPPDLGRRFSSAASLAPLLGSKPQPASPGQRYFADDWQASYRAFVERVRGVV